MEIKLNDQDLDALAIKVADIVFKKMTHSATADAAFDLIREKGKAAAELYLASKEDKWAAADVFRAELSDRATTQLPIIIRTAVDEALGSKDGLRRAVIEQVIVDAKTAAAASVIRHLQNMRHTSDDDEES